jgi:hypothetical protein
MVGVVGSKPIASTITFLFRYKFARSKFGRTKCARREKTKDGFLQHKIIVGKAAIILGTATNGDTALSPLQTPPPSIFRYTK